MEEKEILLEEALSKINIAKEQNLLDLDLRRLNLKKVPDEIYDLKNQLISINLIGNQLSTLPQFFREFKSLRKLHLTENQFTDFPKIVLEMESLHHLCLRSNKIKIFPVEYSDIDHLNDLQISENLIEKVPLTLENVRKLIAVSFHDNPIIDPPPHIMQADTISIINYLHEKKRGIVFHIPISRKIRSAFKQYLVNFNDYVKASKGKEITFEVKNAEEGLEIEVGIEQSQEELHQIENYLKEYVQFIKDNIDSLQINYEISVSNSEDELLKLQIKQEIQHLKMKLEFSEFKEKHLEKEVDRLNNLLVLNAMSEKPIMINIAQNNLTNNCSIPPEIYQEINSLKNHFQKLLASSHLDEEERNFIIEIQQEIIALDDIEEITEIQDLKTWDKIKKFTSNVLERSEKVGKAFKGAKDTVEGAQLIGKKLEYLLELIGSLL